jgi:hypothetical protein
MPLLQVPQDYITGHPTSAQALIDICTALAARAGRAVVEDARTLTAYANIGRWLADCPQCSAGVGVHPDWTESACLSCYHVFRSISVPVVWRDIETALALRPLQFQNWFAGSVRARWYPLLVAADETVEELLAENLAHGIGGAP